MRIGNGRLDALEVKGPFTLADDTQPMIALQWVGKPVPGQKQDEHYHDATITIDNDGSDSSKLEIVLKVKRRNFRGNDLSDIVYTIDGADAKSDWDSDNEAEAATVKDLVDLVNELDGFYAWVLHAPHDASLDSDDFISLSETSINTGTGLDGRGEFLHRDVSDYAIDTNKQVLWARVSLPEERDANAMQLLRVEGTGTGDTAGEIRLYRESYEEGAGEEYIAETYDDSKTVYREFDIMTGPTVRGPLILEVKASDLTAADFRVHLRQASIGA